MEVSKPTAYHLFRYENYLNLGPVEPGFFLFRKHCTSRSACLIKPSDQDPHCFPLWLKIMLKTGILMGESFQDYSWIQDFEADFPLKVSLKMLNLADYNSISHLPSVSLKSVGHLNLKKCWYFVGIIASFEIWISKVQDFQNFEISPINTTG